jgi:hypothetical protein
VGSLPSDSAQQNTVWYSVYRKHSKEAAVNDANSAYLLYRDMAALTPILLLTTIPLGLAVGASAVRTVGLLIGVCVEFLLIVVSARNGGLRLVANVLAIEAAQASGPANTSAPPAAKSPKPRTRKKEDAAG